MLRAHPTRATVLKEKEITNAKFLLGLENKIHLTEKEINEAYQYKLEENNQEEEKKRKLDSAFACLMQNLEYLTPKPSPLHYVIEPQATENNKEDFNKIIEAFKLLCGEDSLKITKDEKGNITSTLLSFESDAQAKEFFKEQAEKGLQFFFQRGNNDHYVYSNGNGQLYIGSKTEIDAIRACETQIENISVVAKTPTLGM